MSVSLYTIKNIEGHDVTFLKMDTKYNTWICAYVRFDTPVNREKYGYPNETYNEGEIYGIDTAHCHNENMTISEKITDAENQIRELILTHDMQ